MVKSHFFLIILVLGFCFSCNNPKSPKNEDKFEIVDLSQVIIVDSLSSVIEKKIVCPLETKEDAIIGRITKVILNDGEIYILDANQAKALYKFGYDGKLLGIYNHTGRGPGEYIRPYDFDIFENGKDLLILGDGKRFIRVDKDFNWIRDIQLEFNSFYFCCLHDLIINQSTTQTGEIKVSNLKGELMQTYLVKDNSSNFYASKPFSKYDNNLYYIRFACDTIFTITNDSIHTSKILTNNPFGSIRGFSEDDYSEVIIFARHVIIVNKRNGEKYLINSETTMDLFGSNINPQIEFFGLSGGFLVAIIEPQQLLEQVNIMKQAGSNTSQVAINLSNLKPTSNPIIVLMRL